MKQRSLYALWFAKTVSTAVATGNVFPNRLRTCCLPGQRKGCRSGFQAPGGEDSTRSELRLQPREILRSLRRRATVPRCQQRPLLDILRGENAPPAKGGRLHLLGTTGKLITDTVPLSVGISDLRAFLILAFDAPNPVDIHDRHLRPVAPPAINLRW